jgi:Rps23 Pro-64 3,4-dihydroxylase Tpa1-like proline 4-hydroxylase
VKGFRGGNLRKVDNEVEADETKAITPIFSGLVTESVSESVAT